MAKPARQPYLSVNQYLVSETECPTRHEHVNSQIYDLAGASMGHTRIEFYCHEQAGETWQCGAYTESDQELFSPRWTRK